MHPLMVALDKCFVVKSAQIAGWARLFARYTMNKDTRPCMCIILWLIIASMDSTGESAIRQPVMQHTQLSLAAVTGALLNLSLAENLSGPCWQAARLVRQMCMYQDSDDQAVKRQSTWQKNMRAWGGVVAGVAGGA
jgi:hypothetical protein